MKPGKIFENLLEYCRKKDLREIVTDNTRYFVDSLGRRQGVAEVSGFQITYKDNIPVAQFTSEDLLNVPSDKGVVYVKSNRRFYKEVGSGMFLFLQPPKDVRRFLIQPVEYPQGMLLIGMGWAEVI